MNFTISSKARGGTTLKAHFSSIPDAVGAVLISHNASGNYVSPLYQLIERVCNENKLSTLRYNFHYIENIPLQDATWEDIEHDISAAYEKLKEMVKAPIYLMGKSLGSAASLYLASQRSNIQGLGLFSIPTGMVRKYVDLEDLKNVNVPTNIWQGTDDKLGTPKDVEKLLSPFLTDLHIHPMHDREHSFESQNSEEENLAVIREVVDSFGLT